MTPPWLAAPAIALILPLAAVGWAWPEDLPFWRSVAIITAWAGSGLLVANLLLMMREPRIAHLLGGLENAYRWHHRSGMSAYLLLLLHPLALALDGWAEAPHLAWQTLAPWLQAWPVWLGWVALLLLMFGLATTFALHLPYRRWRAFHFALGLGVLLGLGHIYVLLGNAAPLLGLVGLAGLALAWRLIASDLGLAAQPYRVAAVSHPAESMVEVSLTPCAAALRVRPGQFVLTAFGEGPKYHGCGEYHPFTVSGIEADGSLKLSIKALGPCSQRIQNLAADTLVRLQGPFGNFLAEPPTGPQLWVAGGIGITPFMSALRARPCRQATTLLYLFRSAGDAAFIDELKARAEADPLFDLVAIATDQGRPDFHAVLKRIDRAAEREVSICGPAPMVKALTPHLQQLGIAPDAIHYESFDFR